MLSKLNDLSEDRNGYKTILQVIIGILVFAISQLTASLIVDFYYAATKQGSAPILLAARGVFEIILFVTGISLYTQRFLKIDVKTIIVGNGKISKPVLILSFALPLTIVAAYSLLFEHDVIFVKRDYFIINLLAALKIALSPGITEELLFRGYIMRLLQKKWNTRIAILIPSITFALMHSMKGLSIAEVVLLFIAGTLAGIMFSLAAYKTNSLLNSVIVHVIWNFFICGAFNISTKIDSRALIFIKFKSENILMTGGTYGVEISIISIVAMSIAICFLHFMVKEKQFNMHISLK